MIIMLLSRWGGFLGYNLRLVAVAAGLGVSDQLIGLCISISVTLRKSKLAGRFQPALLHPSDSLRLCHDPSPSAMTGAHVVFPSSLPLLDCCCLLLLVWSAAPVCAAAALGLT